MRFSTVAFASLASLTLSFGVADAREWSDKSGEYSLEADLISFDDEVVVLRRGDHELVAFAIDKLSDADRLHLKSEEAKADAEKSFAAAQKWTLKNGLTINGKVVDFADRDVTFDRRRNRIFVNDRLMNNLPEFYQQIMPQIVAHEGKIARADGRELRRWLIKNDEPQTFHVQGVVIEDESGDEYAVPFFLFSDADLKLLQPGWEKWLEAHLKQNYEAEEDMGFLLRSLAAARQQDEQVQRQIAMMQLNMQAIQAGVTSLWEVTLYPAAGKFGPPLWVVVTGRNNLEAVDAAMKQYPGHVAGPVRRVSRRR